MKQIVFIGLVGISIIACSQKESTQKTDSIPKIETVQNSVQSEEPNSPTKDIPTEQTDGKTLITNMDCFTCHKEDAKLIGPSYQDIANKYTEADADQLADKIINGGTGVWGQVPMAPHAGLSKENAKKMVMYILSLKK